MKKFIKFTTNSTKNEIRPFLFFLRKTKFCSFQFPKPSVLRRNTVYSKKLLFWDRTTLCFGKGTNNVCCTHVIFQPTLSAQKKEIFSKNKEKKGKENYFKSSGLLAQKEIAYPQTRGLCAISGGQDSMITFFVLLHVLFFLRKRNKKTKTFFIEEKKNKQRFSSRLSNLEVVNCQHFWQPKNFFSSKLVFQVSFLFQVPYTLILPSTLLLSENDSRRWRKKIFYRFSRFDKIPTLITGHTESDVLETNLNNLLRGTSPKSLSKSQILNYKKTLGSFFSTLFLKPKISNYKLAIREKEIKIIRKIQKNNLFCFLSNKRRVQIYKPTSRIKNNVTFFSSPAVPFPKNSLVRKTRFFVKVPNRVFRATKMNLVRSCWSQNQVSSSFCFYSKQIKNEVTCLKPIQNLNRFTVSKLANLYQIPISIDVTNFSLIFSRNKIRHQLVPFVRLVFNKKIELLLIKFFSLVDDENQQINNQLFELYTIFKLSRAKFPQKSKSLTKQFFKNYTFRSKKLRWSFSYASQKTKFFGKVCVSNLFLLSTQNNRMSLQRTLLQKTMVEYREIELNFLQVYKLQTFIQTIK